MSKILIEPIIKMKHLIKAGLDFCKLKSYFELGLKRVPYFP
jgi:hypothetical protein